MSTESDLPNWLTPGQSVVIIRGRDNLPSHPLRIDRVLKRDVVLDNGDRWTIPNLRDGGSHIIKHGQGYWSSSALFPEDAPQVAQARQRDAEARLANEAVEITEELTKAIRRGLWLRARQQIDRLAELVNRAEALKAMKPWRP